MTDTELLTLIDRLISEAEPERGDPAYKMKYWKQQGMIAVKNALEKTLRTQNR